MTPEDQAEFEHNRRCETPPIQQSALRPSQAKAEPMAYRDPVREALVDAVRWCRRCDGTGRAPNENWVSTRDETHIDCPDCKAQRAALAAPSAVEEMIAFVDKIREADLEEYYMPSWMGKEARALIAKYGAAP